MRSLRRRWKRRRLPDAGRIAADRPFAGELQIRRIEPIPGGGGNRRGAFFVTAEDGRRFKLRICTTAIRARKIERLIRRFPHLFPPLHGREGRYLLLERLDGYRIPDEEALTRNCRALGRLCGEIHEGDVYPRAVGALIRKIRSLRAYRKFQRELRSLRRHEIIDAQLHDRLRELFRDGFRRYGLPISLELRDLHRGNFMVNAQGDLRFVDEEGLGYFVKGLGFGKLLAGLAQEESWRAFRAGYAEVTDASYLTAGYIRLVRIVEGVHSVESKLRRRAEASKLEKSLEALRRAAA